MLRSAPRLLVAFVSAVAALSLTTAEEAWKPPSTKKWIEVKTEHFTVYSEAGADKTRKLATQLERFRRALAHISSGFRLDSPVPTAMFVFRDDASYGPYKLDEAGRVRNVAGYFLPRPFGNYITLDGSAGSEPMRIVYHEYFHAVVDASLGGLPAWLNEGLAEYHSTFRERTQSTIVEVGHPIDDHLAVIDGNAPLPWDEVFRTTTDSRTYNESTKQGAFYAQSWLLAHYLCADPARAKALGKYLSLLRAGTADDEAFAQAFGTTRAELGDAAARYRQTGSRQMWFDLGEQAGKVETTERAMEPAEVLFRLGDLLAHQGRTADARRHLEATRGMGWPAGPIDSALGYAAFLDDDRAQAPELWRRAIDAGATTNEPAVLLAELILDDYSRGPVAGTAPTETASPVLDARQLLQTALARDANDFRGLFALGRTYFLGAGDVGPGVVAAERARTLRPLSVEILWLHACLLARQGRPEHAWIVIERNLAPRGREAAAEAAECATHGAIVAARDRADAGDREGARSILAAAIEATPAEALDARLRSADSTLASGGKIRFRESVRDEKADAYDEAIRLANAGKPEKALEKLDALLRDCGTHPTCEAAERSAEELRRVIAANRLVRKFNDAVALANSLDRKPAITLLRELEQEVTDPKLLAEVQNVLRSLGARVAKPE